MIIDLILDRKDGVAYDKNKFYRMVRDYDVQPFSNNITYMMDFFGENLVKRALCEYVIGCKYNPSICDYINSVEWL